MTVKEFINAIAAEEANYELLISSDEEGNSYHTIDRDITCARIQNGVLMTKTQGKPNVLILTPYKEVEQE